MTHRSKVPSRWLVGAALALAHVSIASSASAQTPAEVAARRALLSQAEEASRAGNHAQALELGERAGRISMTPSLRFFLATEQRALGHFADALGNAELCAQTADRDTTLRNRAALISQCRGLITELQPQVAHVTVRAPSPAPQGLQITIAGAPMSDAFWGVPFSVNPGHVSIDATAPNHAPFHREIDIAAAGSAEVAIDVGPEIASSSPPPTNEVVASAPPSSAPPTTAPVQAPSGPGAAPFVLMGGGALVAVAGVILVAVVRPNALDRLDRDCLMSRICADTSRGPYDTALGATIGGGVALGVGVALIGAGLGWFFASRSSERPRAIRNAGISPLAEGGAMLSIGGVL